MCTQSDRRMENIETMIKHIEIILEIKPKLMPLVKLMSLSNELNPRLTYTLTTEEIGNLGYFLREELDKLFFAVDGIEEMFRRCFYVGHISKVR